ncbi:2-phosphoxylose phosphatase 1-like [Pecten maximus]|uniref:2-phosphoxylose phosphatase 1-like n=1 Tax=Pecten maximus TaxID=6579 RepID=UPI0014581DC6|nr:2-phosphoxylose phosphatase 1-like [Pecten maximus]
MDSRPDRYTAKPARHRSFAFFIDENDSIRPNIQTEYSVNKRRHALYIFAVLTGLFVVFTSTFLYVFGPMDDELSSVSDTKLPHHIFRRSTSNGSFDLLHIDQNKAGEFLRDGRVADHCHLPNVPALGMEDVYMKEIYTLEQVHVILSSGETTPQQVHPDIPLADCNYNSYGSGPLEDFPNKVNRYIRANKALTKFINHTISHEKKCPPGQLSPLGMAKLRQHGRYLRGTYLESFKSKLELYHSNKWIKVMSGQDASSFHSTLSFLSGFLPQKHLHRVNIEKVTNNLCDMSQTDCQCPRIARSASFSLDNVSTHIQEYQPEHPDQSFSNFFDNFSKRHTSAVEAFGQLSPLICDESLPSIGCRGNRCWNVSRSHVINFFQAVDKHMKKWMNHIPNIEHSRFHAYPFLNSLLQTFKNFHPVRSPRFFVYTSNEEFMLQVLTAIEYKLDKFPRPGSRLVFELLSTTENQKKKYFLRVLFNGRDVTTDIPLCRRRDSDRICPLKYFVDYHSLNFRNMFSQSSYTERCML